MESLHIIKGLWNLSNIGAENSDTRIRLERDSLGRAVKEWQDAHWISSRYDEMGERIETTSSFGASILTRRNEMGQAAQVIAYMDKERPWEAAMEYNALGQETSRLVSGGVYSSWKYDATGRPISHEVNLLQRGTCRQHNSVGGISGYSETKRRRSYEWDVSCQLKKVTNELTKGTTIFSYDQFSNLVSARESGFETIFRTTDTVGNLFETQDNSDRIYGGGSRLEQSGIDLKEKRNKYQGGYGKLVTKGRKFFYDEEGNLAKKIEPGGGTWTYLYFGNGMLKEVIRPDQSAIRFKYDAFGRRTEKVVTGKKREKVIRFLWNGNMPFHEWEEMREADRKQPKVKVEYQADFMQRLAEREAEKARQKAGQKQPENLITWVFQDDFIPRGKLTRTGNYSIISDYLGTPVEAYDGEGIKVWERELDIYGRVKNVGKGSDRSAAPETGEQCFIPFRFQGQYEDKEIGLYYNRFRYYDPSLGQYTQQDPIGLAGGNPTLYGYVFNTMWELDPFGLDWKDLLETGLGHHLFPRSVAKKLGIEEWAKLTAYSWYPYETAGSGALHQKLHRLLIEQGVPFHGSKFMGTLEDFWDLGDKAYESIDVKGYLKVPFSKNSKIYNDLTPQEALRKIRELQEAQKAQKASVKVNY